MRLGLYIFASMLLMAIVGGVTFVVNPNHFTTEAMGINLTFPAAVWVVLPMFILFVFTLIHMMFYGLKNYFMLKRWQKDASTLEDALYWSLVGEPKEQKYAVDVLGTSALLLSKSSLNVSESIEGLSPRLAQIAQLIQKINKGEYVDFKVEKLSKAFHSQNPILSQNNLNRLQADEKFVEEVLKSSSDYSDEVRAKALELFVSKESFEKARKYFNQFETKHLMTMLARITPENTLELTPAVLREFEQTHSLKCEDFVQIALVTKKYFKPDENLTLFRGFQSSNEAAQNAYLYLLFEYELLEQVDIFLDEQGQDEFMQFRALYELKKQNHKYKLEDMIDLQSACK